MRKVLLVIFSVVALGGIFLAFFQHRQALAVATEFGEAANIGDYLNLVIPWLTGIIGGLAVLMLIYAGYIYLTSQGNPEGVSQAKDIIIGVVVGIMLLFLMELILVRTIGISL